MLLCCTFHGGVGHHQDTDLGRPGSRIPDLDHRYSLPRRHPASDDRNPWAVSVEGIYGAEAQTDVSYQREEGRYPQGLSAANELTAEPKYQ